MFHLCLVKGMFEKRIEHEASSEQVRYIQPPTKGALLSVLYFDRWPPNLFPPPCCLAATNSRILNVNYERITGRLRYFTTSRECSSWLPVELAACIVPYHSYTVEMLPIEQDCVGWDRSTNPEYQSELA